jgi:chromosome segregation ATPase
MGHKEKLEARRKELMEQIEPLAKELAEIDELLGTHRKEREQKKKAEEARLKAMSDAASHADWCYGDRRNGCLGQCMVR